MCKIKVEKRVHPHWKSNSDILGKYQYIYKNWRGSISLIELLDYWSDGKDLWEILCWKGNLFKGIERFETFEEADKQARKHLNTGWITRILNKLREEDKE